MQSFKHSIRSITTGLFYTTVVAALGASVASAKVSPESRAVRRCPADADGRRASGKCRWQYSGLDGRLKNCRPRTSPVNVG